ncbi:MAG: hypothetical protein GW839_03275 [Flavobacteriales bacterium]|nr:hypothetical protein [Flavobacteriia bacterium]NCP05051.1 hypothetical protein [Flavobacteriales bacterium]PIV92587.1 MAG: hypothetical protein COW44_13415 [Flavobacteriaceae bacterium CG17_big_fil_post_rev_8_21_14_2_50_33_15]PIY12988.1 MAG: hypothetical protein COZ17_02125 [Flavobacteriaceae bacterium CG_4_10_14_3_um_filter_33_47]PJB20098.1 MAG: hypothetical protein CO117_02335 [Flavobacteriaceae bacterium CG_4_9_14_3_um_filter_33_16]
MKIKFLIIFFFIVACVSNRKVVKRCPNFFVNDFTEVLIKEHKTTEEKDIIIVNELRFECVFSALYSHKVMYDKFGAWDEVIYPAKIIHPVLSWKNVDLFSNGEKYNVFTYGVEEWKHIYVSVVVLDENENDLLNSTSNKKDVLIKYFTNMIKNNNAEKVGFYEKYWSQIDPKRWEWIKSKSNK